MTHMHITAWVVGLILLLVSYAMYKTGNKSGKILHMILRLVYLLIIITGFLLFINNTGVYTNSAGILGEVIVKMIAGIWVIGAMVLSKISKAKPAKSAWIQLIVALLIVLVLGFGRLPFGVQFMG